MMSGGPALRPYLGLAVQPVDQDLALALGLTEARGALVSDVLPSGPAAEAGVMPGDVVVRVGDFAVNSHVELRALVGRMPADQPIQLEVVREGEVRKLLVKAAVKEPLEVPPPPPPGLPPGQSLLEAVEVGPGPQGQPVVTAFHPYMVVATRPLAVGDRILEVDRNPVESVEDFRALRERTRNADRLLLRIDDGGMRRYLVLKRP
jgi:serine protease Do